MSADREGYLFPYRDEGNPPVKRPTVDLRLSSEELEWTCRALIDSGSPRTIFDRGMADALCIRIGNAGSRTESIGLMGRENLAIQIETVGLALVGMDGDPWETEVGFIKDGSFQMPFQGVLGHRGFLDRFDVRFSGYREEFVIDRPAG